ncbi:MAG: CARDB domain-containing protein, partial [archaeon]
MKEEVGPTGQVQDVGGVVERRQINDNGGRKILIIAVLLAASVLMFGLAFLIGDKSPGMEGGGGDSTALGPGEGGALDRIIERSLSEKSNIIEVNSPLEEESSLWKTKDDFVKDKIEEPVPSTEDPKPFPDLEETAEDILLRNRVVSLNGVSSGAQESAIARGGDKMHAIMQFDRIPDFEDRRELEQQGIKLLSYVPNNAWVVSFDSDNLGGVASSSTKANVVAIESIIVDDKISEEIKEKRFTKESLNNDGTVDVVVLFYEDVADSSAASVISQHGGEILEHSTLSDWYLVKLGISEIDGFVLNDEVKMIEQIFPRVVHNDGARENLGVDILQEAPYGLSGAGVTVGEWDEGHAFHTDYNDRVVYGDSSWISDHSVHVAGTVLGSGLLSEQHGGTPLQWRGMAPQANLISSDWFSTFEEYVSAIQIFDMDISTNSWSGGDSSMQPDIIDGLIRGSAGKPVPIFWSAANGGDYFRIAGQASAKNVIAIGASNSNDDSIAGFSSRGPSDFDGRLKPDVTGPGCEIGGTGDIWSTYPGDEYGGFCGTSMSAPATAGSAALMLEQHRELYSVDPFPSTVKGILAHTAEDFDNVGPDYTFGYGRVNMVRAIDYIIGGNFLEVQIQNGEADVYPIDVSGSDPLKVTLVWDDFPADISVGLLLVNDLDLVLVDPSGGTHYPWVLDNNNPETPATKGEDHLNNIEQVVVDNPMAGQWEIQVIGYNLPELFQSYSLVTEESFVPLFFDVEVSIPFVESPILSGELNLISVKVENNGAEVATDVGLSLYDESIGALMGSQTIPSISPGEIVVVDFNWWPGELGEGVLRAVIDVVDADLNNNMYLREFLVVGDAPDVSGLISEPFLIVVDNSNVVEGSVYNIGTQSADVNVELYDEWDVLIGEVFVGALGPSEIRDVSFNWTPDVVGWQNLRMVVSAPDDYNPYNDEFETSARVRPEALDLSVWNDLRWRVFTNLSENNLPIHISNTGGRGTTGAINVSVWEVGNRYWDGLDWVDEDVRPYDLSNVEFNGDYLDIIGGNSFVIEDLLGVGYAYPTSHYVTLSFYEDETGEHIIKTVVDTVGEWDYSDNSDVSYIKVHPNASDVEGRIFGINGPMVVGKENIIEVGVENWGPLPATNVAVELYEYEAVWDGTDLVEDNFVLIGETFIGDLGDYWGNPVPRDKDLFYSYTPTELGDARFKLVVSADNDWDLSNNEDTAYWNVIPDASDVTGRIKTSNAIVDELNGVEAEIWNDGVSEASDVNVRLYENDEFWNGTDLVDNLTLVDEIFVGTLFPEEGRDLNFEWIPTELGGTLLEMVIEASDDGDLSNNEINRWVTVLLDAPEVNGRIETHEAVVDEPNIILARIGNDGFQEASDVDVRLYESDEFWNGTDWTENLTFIGESFVGALLPGESKQVSFEWVPTELGHQRLKMIIEAPGDGDLSNNEVTRGIFVVSYVPDVTGSIYVAPAFFLDEDTEVRVVVQNDGVQPSENVNAKLYEIFDSAKVLLWERDVGDVSQYDELWYDVSWNSGAEGEYVLQLELTSDIDSDLTNNIINRTVRVGPPIEINYTANSILPFETLAAFGYDGDIDEAPPLVDGSVVFSLPDVPTDIGTAYVQDFGPEENVFALVFSDSALEPRMSTFGKMISETRDVQGLTLYETYAVVPDWQYDGAQMYFVGTLEGIGVPSGVDVGIYACSTWDPVGDVCQSDWFEVEIVDKEEGGEASIFLLGSVEEGHVEAFGVGVGSVTGSCSDLSCYPEMFIEGNTLDVGLVYGSIAPSTDFFTIVDITNSITSYVGSNGLDQNIISVSDLEISALGDMGFISVGRPCENLVTDELLGNPGTCDYGVREGVGKIKLLNDGGRSKMLVYGYDAGSTTTVSEILSNWEDYNLQGTEMCFDKITLQEVDCLNECVNPVYGLVSWWPMENGLGPGVNPYVRDIWDGNDGTYECGQSCSSGPGVVGDGKVFDGLDDYIRVSDAEGLSVGSFSVETWLRPNILSSSGGLVFFMEAVTDDIFMMGFDDDPVDGMLSCFADTVREGNIFVQGPNSVLPVNEWSHVACTYDQVTGHFYLYVNGEVKETYDGLENNPIDPGADRALIGGPDEFFDGSIDELSIYNRALDPSEIQAIYNAGSSGKCLPDVVDQYCSDNEYFAQIEYFNG